MLNKLAAFLRQQKMILPGDRVICAVSGGADSVALLFAMYLLREKLEINPSDPRYIKVVWGQGYKFEKPSRG